MGNWHCSPQNMTHFAAVARDFCPFPDYSPSPLFNILTVNSSLQLSEHYAAVQASLTPPQQQDFTQTLRSTFGREGKVSNGGVGVVALSLAVLFNTVARQVKGEYESYQEPIPGLFIRDPRGTYPAPVHTISRYLRLVPHIANNPTRMRDETEKYLLELMQTAAVADDNINTAQRFEDTTGVNIMKCAVIGQHMILYLQRFANKTIDLDEIVERNQSNINNRLEAENLSFLFNCDPKEASERFLAQLDSFDDHTKNTFKDCNMLVGDSTAIEGYAMLHWASVVLPMRKSKDEDVLAQTGDFDLKAKALGKWI